ncbi:cytochrome oxidase assembly, partial [Jaminaea rosea]
IRSTAPADPATTTPPSPSASPQPDTSAKPTSKWVGYHSLFLAFLVYAIVVVGGLTRLTESGLSITEWNPGFKGMWLPTTTDEWEGEWAKYRQTPEFVLLNSKMSLEDFKTIYMWEWSHRILGRVIGLAYVLPAAFFVARGMVKSPFRSKLLLIGLGIGAQGAMGWYMVKSGLAAPQGTLHQPHSDALAPPKTSSTPAAWTPRVSHFRLAAHLGLAFLVYAGMLRTGLSVLRQYNLAMNVGKASGLKAAPGVRDKLVAVLSKPQVLRYRRFVGAVTGLVFATAMSGALVAGLDAGLVYNEFPTMGDGRIAPPLDEMFDERYTRSSGASSRDDEASSSSLVLHNLTQNPVTVQFVHRCLAITTFAHVAALAWKTRNLSATMRLAGTALPPAVPRLAYLALGAATAQATLGITTLIYMVPIELASAHQAGSVALLSVMLALWGTLR